MTTRSQSTVAVVLRIDGYELKRMFLAGSAWLKAHVDHVNQLNVFPVPDGDTGTNMWLTLKAAEEAMADLQEGCAGRVAAIAAEGALMGARGNSGVILSQILQGLAEGMAKKDQLSTLDLAGAFEQARVRAYAAVINPVEGTMLTIINNIAQTSRQEAEKTPSVAEFWPKLLTQAQLCLNETPNMLPMLKAAGVVDSGGQGLVYFMAGIERHLRGLPLPSANMPDTATARTALKTAVGPPKTTHGYDVQFLIHGSGLDVAFIRQKIDALGDSALVVGQANRVRVHVHVQDPGQPLSFGATQGVLSDVVVENMDEQAHAFLSQDHQPQKIALSPPPPQLKADDIGLICVVPGLGFSKIFRSLGAHQIIYGGQGVNPNIQAFVDSLKHLKSDQILVLPNHKNIISAALHASEMSDKTVAVIPSTSLPQGISAMLTFNPNESFSVNKNQMNLALEQVHSIEITYAARSSLLNGLPIQQGEVLGLLNGDIVAHAQQIEAVVLAVFKQLDMAALELVSLYYGQTVNLSTAKTLTNLIETHYPHLEIEVLPGGQAHYPYIISLE